MLPWQWVTKRTWRWPLLHQLCTMNLEVMSSCTQAACRRSPENDVSCTNCIQVRMAVTLRIIVARNIGSGFSLQYRSKPAEIKSNKWFNKHICIHSTWCMVPFGTTTTQLQATYQWKIWTFDHCVRLCIWWICWCAGMGDAWQTPPQKLMDHLRFTLEWDYHPVSVWR